MNLVDSALGTSTAQKVYSNDSFTVATGGLENLKVNSTAAGGFILASVESSTSDNTTVTIKSADGGSSRPIDLGRAGLIAFALAASTVYTISIYDGGNSSFSATVNVWYFHS
jgi:hypothetical protein